jgi:ATP-dependent 26S proteasome regulatory subunit
MMVEKVPDSTYEMVGGLDKQIKEIKEVIELPVKHPELFDALGIAQPKGVLLYGPPGTGNLFLQQKVHMFRNDGHKWILPAPINVEHMKYGESLFSHLQYKNISINIKNYNFATCLVLVWNFISDVKRTRTEGIKQ